MVYVTGDIHGDITRFDAPELKRLKRGDVLIICGDFGFIWDLSKNENKHLKALSKKKYTICFVDGTHENFDKLNSYPVSEWNGGKVHKISDNIFHLMRGQVFTINAMTYFTMGGGESPDVDIRFSEDTWSRLEMPDRDELMAGAENLEKRNLTVDFIITHEPPLKVKSFLVLKDGEGVQVNALNSYLEELSQICRYKRWFFGSLHLDKHISLTQTAVFKKIIDPISNESIG